MGRPSARAVGRLRDQPAWVGEHAPGRLRAAANQRDRPGLRAEGGGAMRRIAPALGLAAVVVAVAGCATSSGTSTSALAPARTPIAAPTTARTTTRDPTPASAPRTVRAKPTSAPPRGIPPAHPVPAAFRVAAGAPSDAEVRRELAQMYAIQHQQQKLAAFSPVAGNYLQLLPWSLERKINQVSVASVFRDYN